jgi:hypothetical protein
MGGSEHMKYCVQRKELQKDRRMDFTFENQCLVEQSSTFLHHPNNKEEKAYPSAQRPFLAQSKVTPERIRCWQHI